MTGFFSPKWWMEKDEHVDCTPEHLYKAVQGYFTADAMAGAFNDHQRGISNLVRTITVKFRYILYAYVKLTPRPYISTSSRKP